MGTARSALVRLYDLTPSAPRLMLDGASPRIAGATPMDLARLAGEPVGSLGLPPTPGPQGDVLLATVDAKLLGWVGVNVLGAGTVGPVRLASPADEELGRELLAAALWRLRWRGYAYGMVAGEDRHHAGPDVREAMWEIPDSDGDKRIGRRDVPELEWADIFVDLRSHPAPKPVVELELDGYPVQVRRPEASEQLLIVDWVAKEFGRGWAAEMQRAFAHDPISAVVVARRGYSDNPQECLLGFIAYNTARFGMLSSIALAGDARGRNAHIAMELLNLCLAEARQFGMDYAVLGGVSRRLGALRVLGSAWTIPGSCPGIFGKGIRDK